MHELANGEEVQFFKKGFQSETTFRISPVTFTSTHSAHASDLVGDNGVAPHSTSAQNKKPALSRNHTAPMSAAPNPAQPSGEAAQEPTQRRRTMDRDAHSARPTTAGEGSGHRRTRTREVREKDKKAMLSKALQKANTAVVLDNAQNFEGALGAYSDACRLLQHVMDRSSTADDKRKLESIRITYTNRIEELHDLEMNRPAVAEDKSLPARPMSDDSDSLSPKLGGVSVISATVRNSAVIDTATMQRIVSVPKPSYPMKEKDGVISRKDVTDLPLRAGQEAQQINREAEPVVMSTAETRSVDQDGEKEVDQYQHIITTNLTIPQLDESRYMPAPLSPRKPFSPMLQPEPGARWQQGSDLPRDIQEEANPERTHPIDPSVSWLDTIDESGSDCASSVHSVTNGAVRRKHIRGTSGGTDPDFDAAFDAAVEAAYDEGFEPDMEARKQSVSTLEPSRTVSNVVPEYADQTALSLDSELSDEEEERLLDEITSDYAHGFNFDISSKSALPRQSDSSGYARSTWQSSQASGKRDTAASSLTTVAEDASQKPLEADLAAGQEQTELSAPPLTALPRPPSMVSQRLSGVRDRRLSGQPNSKQLMIETMVRSDGRKLASATHYSPSATSQTDEQREALDRDFKFGANLEPTPTDAHHAQFLNSPPPLDVYLGPDAGQQQTAAVPTVNRVSMEDESPGELRSARPHFFRKNKSSVSLRERTVLHSPDDSVPSLATPMSSTFLSFASKRSQDPLISQRTRFPPLDSYLGGSLQNGGAYLFDTSLSMSKPPTSPRSPTSSTQPAALEPCPESFLLRPFWLMRAIASTITHPKGGFLTTRLFVSREVWLTRGVKLKYIEDKIANCDLLTAALGRLSGVDTFDADSVLVELQSFEEVMERVQTALSKKLGSDVGLQGVSALFKDAPSGGASGATSQGGDSVSGAERISKGKEAKGYLHSWRKLRSKSSGTPLAMAQQAGRAMEKDMPTLSSVPMTSFVPVERRGARKDVRNMTFEGPQKEYMGSLARLFEGVQVLDHIARQVEDPGLKYSSPTHVGLELCIRHAAEFFGFYICRFALADLGILIDKSVKRGTEWVLV